MFWTLLAGIVIGAALQAYVLATRPDERRARALTWAIIGVLLLPFGLIPLAVIGAAPGPALACVPGTALVLWLLHHAQRLSRIPLAMLLVAFGWGALIVFGLGRASSNLAFGTINGFALNGHKSDLAGQIHTQYRIIDGLLVHLGLVNALLVAAGVVLLLTLFRHRVTDAVTGLVVGAAIGLGYNLVESVLFIRLFGMLSAFNGATGGFEYWIRQSIGLLGGQVAFGAVLGAGIGLAAQAHDRGQRRRTAAAALVAAAGGAIATETLAAWLSHLAHDHITVGGPLDTLIISPFFWLLPQVPFILVAVLILVHGTRVRGAAARAAVSAETASGPAVTRQEAPFLIDPAVRFWTLIGTWRLHGWNGLRTLRRLQTAQLDLAAWRWQHPDPTGEEGNALRAKVMRLKTGPTPQPMPPAPAPRPGQAAS
ncbi:PrsW family glutamic-type intramembrane protease [Actinomadura sp. NTSP31]|uniref:PrsW family glutamic-type intramembrane protease n=1 Tax=Actinomadura sp. NTSP31 TaxID=1735447 RepID=UPI0035C0670C